MLHGTAYDERGPGFIDQYAVHLIHNGVMKTPLHKILKVELHIISQVIKPEFVVRAVGNIASIGCFPVFIGHAMNNDSHGKS